MRVVDPDGDTGSTLIDLSAKVNEYSDLGLLGIAADADFESNGYLYLLYVLELDPLHPDSNAPMGSRLTRVTVRSDNTLVLPAGSTDPETVILGKDSNAPCPAANNTLDCITADFYWQHHRHGALGPGRRHAVAWERRLAPVRGGRPVVAHVRREQLRGQDHPHRP